MSEIEIQPLRQYEVEPEDVPDHVRQMLERTRNAGVFHGDVIFQRRGDQFLATMVTMRPRPV